MRVARLFLFADWPEKYFSGQSEGRISNASGTPSVRVSAQGLSRSCCKLSPMKIPLSRLAAPGSPRMCRPKIWLIVNRGNLGRSVETYWQLTCNMAQRSRYVFCNESCSFQPGKAHLGKSYFLNISWIGFFTSLLIPHSRCKQTLNV